jgi:hypothetical protein
MVGRPINLVGEYYGNSDGGNGTNNIAWGWENLTIGEYIHKRAAPFRIDRNQSPIGWAPRKSIRFI